ncbi:MAG: sugar phosphate nucleotidyltransferase [Nitrospira sp.]
MENQGFRENVWSIVLAGGDGSRTKEFMRQWFNYDQYCAFDGTRSLFQYTLDRAARITPWERIAVVAARHHQHEIWPQLDGRPAGMVLLQPKNVDTAAGSFLALAFILARDPPATVVIHPSDSFIYPGGPFSSMVEQLVRGSVLLGGRPVLLAAKPGSLELESGWIKPGRFLGWTGKASVHAVERYLENPVEAVAREAMADGSLWNTRVLAAHGRELWSMGHECFPEFMSLFERLKAAIDTAAELRVLDEIYGLMPHRNFSSHLLQCAPERLAVMEMTDVLWSDRGGPGRTLSHLEKIGEQPMFSHSWSDG